MRTKIIIKQDIKTHVHFFNKLVSEKECKHFARNWTRTYDWGFPVELEIYRQVNSKEKPTDSDFVFVNTVEIKG